MDKFSLKKPVASRCLAPHPRPPPARSLPAQPAGAGVNATDPLLIPDWLDPGIQRMERRHTSPARAYGRLSRQLQQFLDSNAHPFSCGSILCLPSVPRFA